MSIFLFSAAPFCDIVLPSVLLWIHSETSAHKGVQYVLLLKN